MFPDRDQLATAAVLSIYILASLLTYDQIEEDAFIYFRFAENIAGGDGYVFNRGGPPVEAGSALAWQLLLVPLQLLPISIITSAKLLGMFFGAISLVLTTRLSGRLIGDRLARHVPALLTAISVPFVMWCQRGLETAFYTTAVLWLALVLVDERPTPRWLLPAAVLFLARPEGFYLLLVLVPFFIAKRDRLWVQARPLAVLCAVVLAVTIWRLAYFHDVVPHPFYVKMQFVEASSLEWTHFFLQSSHFYLYLSPFLVYVWQRSFWSAERLMLLSLLALLLGWNFMVGDFKAYFRHMVPAIALTYVACVVGIEHLTRSRWRIAKPVWYAILGLLVIDSLPLWNTPVALHSVSPNPIAVAASRALNEPAAYLASTARKISAPSSSPPLGDPRRDAISYNYQALAGKFIALNYPGEITIVYDQMGQTPWYAGADKTFIDSLGLTDRATGAYYFAGRTRRSKLLGLYDSLVLGAIRALFPGEKRAYTEQEILDYLFAAEPHLIMTNQLAIRLRPRSLPALLEKDPRLSANYARRFKLDRWVMVYERKDLPRRAITVPKGLVIREL